MMKKYKLILLTILLCFLCGCSSTKKTEINFDIDDNFEIVSVEKENNNYSLIIKSEKDIKEYLKKFKTINSSYLGTLKIELYHTTAKDYNFSEENLKNYIGLIEYSTSNNFYKMKRYIDLPNIEASDYLSEFTTDNIEETKNEINIEITMKNTDNLKELISEVKTYANLVKELNDTNKIIKITVNNTYIYEYNSSILTKIEKITI